ncbi:MAG: PQQ-binding-like beta-propeller repeat protein [Acidobacteria bacterium]|nr:PQQ-binding-like beta-propeller repeat protein [Acidobacteriota bacterium]
MSSALFSWSRRRLRAGFLCIAAALLLMVSAGALTAARSSKWWWDNLGGPTSSHYVDLDQVNKANVGRLEVAWFYPYGNLGFNPIVVEDVMYVSGRNNALIALDASTGKEIWIHENIPGLSVRGVNYWQSTDGKDKRILFTTGPFLQALDAKTGKSVLAFGTNGHVDLRQGLDRGEYGVRVPNPGKVFENLLILGSAPGEGWMSPPGDIRAYDVQTGKLVWQFHTVPRPGEFGYETWPKDAYKYVGGANTWGEMSVDEARGIVYLPTGSGTYDFYGGDRHGANLFANCLLALDARTGKRLWHFQNIHHDLWDWDNVSAPQLVTIRHNGRRVDAVAMAGKTGFLYVFDRVSGQPIWPIEERPVPQTDVPGEQSWPTQPFPTVVPPFGRQHFTVDDINPWLLTKEQQDDWKARVPAMRNEGLFTPPALRETVSMPGNQGGSNWGTTAANPDKGYVYVLNIDAVAILKLDDVRQKVGGFQSMGAGIEAGRAAFNARCAECHGEDMKNPKDDAPSLVGVTERYSEDIIAQTVTGGYGNMRAVPNVDNVELTAILTYLAASSGSGGPAGRGAAPPAFPAGPVVASGGAPIPALQNASGATPPARRYPGNGANGGNAAYPEGVAVPATRYVSEWGVQALATKPPYSTLTAYDLNTGAIKWQIPTGDDPATIAAGGPKNTGSPMLRNGIMPTKAGLIFMAGNDGKMRAYDEETGKTVWEGPLPGPSRGVPAIYESKGRQFIVVAALPPGGGRGGAVGTNVPGGPAKPVDPNAPRGYIAFALPRR